MDNKKYEQLINLIINEDQEKASELFHEIVVEKSREIYESIMADEDMMEGDVAMGDDEEESMEGSQVGDLMDEINAEESGISEEEEDEEVFDLEAGDEEEVIGDEGEDETEEAVIRIEDKLDELLNQFKEIMGSEEGADDFAGDEEGEEEVDAEMDDEEEAMMEAVQLQKVSVTHGDNGAQTKSPVAANSGKAGMDSKPVNFGSADEKGRTAPAAKDVEGASKFKNAPGHRSQDLSSAPKPKHGDNGANNKSPVAK